jgi:hypothetical protein
MPSFSDLVDETLIALSGYTQRQDQSTYLTAAMTDTQTTMTVADAATLSKGLVEVGDELMWIESFDRATNVATIAPYGRGFRSTQKAPHNIGDRVTISPSFPKDVIRKQLNNSVSGVFPDIFGVFYTTFNFISSQNTYELPSEADFEMLYGNLKTQGTISFWSTSFIRGTTLDNAIVIVDEFQNLNFHELDSIITRVGENSKIMFCGDATQSDLIKTNEKNGIIDFMKVLRVMPSIDIIEFGVEDIVRSGFVKEYILAKMEVGV